MAALAPRHYSRPTSYDDGERKNLPHPPPHNLFIQTQANASDTLLAPPTVPTSTRRKRTSSLPSAATLLKVAQARQRTSAQADRSPLALHSIHAEESPKMPSKGSKESSVGSPSSFGSSTEAKSPRWYSRWFFGAPSPPAEGRPRTKSLTRKSKRFSHFPQDVDAPPVPVRLPSNPYWHEKETTLRRRESINAAEMAESAGDDYAF